MDQETVRHLLRLARLEESDAADLEPDLLRIVSFVDGLKAIDIESVLPFTPPADTVTRADRVAPGLATEEVLDSAADHSATHFRVPS